MISMRATFRRLCHYMQQHHAHRTLFCDSSLKIDHYMRRRLLLKDTTYDDCVDPAVLCSNLEGVQSLSTARQSLFDFVDLLYTAERSDLGMIQRHFQKLSEYKSLFEMDWSFHFGAIFLRLCHHLETPDEAYSVFMNPEFSFIFNDSSSTIILMDLLYKHKQFDRVLEVFYQIENYNISSVTLAIGAYYHQNTFESFQRSQVLVDKYASHSDLSRRAILFAVCLALNQDQPATAFETLRAVKSNNNMTTNLKFMCQARAGDINAIFSDLQKVLFQVQKEVNRPLQLRLYSDTMSDIRQAVRTFGEPEEVTDLQQLENELRKYGALSIQVLTAFLDREISSVL